MKDKIKNEVYENAKRQKKKNEQTLESLIYHVYMYLLFPKLDLFFTFVDLQVAQLFPMQLAPLNRFRE